MSNVFNLQDFKAPVKLPTALTDAKTWLVWRLVQMPGEKKPKKIPYYTNGEARQGSQGDEADRNRLVSFDRATAAVAMGRYSGVGLAMLRENGLIAIDFDDCVIDGKIDAKVQSMIQGTYSEFSPSGTGIRAFFRGSLRDRKSHAVDATTKARRWPFGVEFFHAAGYVTVTGNLTPMCSMFEWDQVVAPLNNEMLALYRERFDDDGQGGVSDFGGDDWLLTLAPKIGLSLEKARAMIGALDEDCGYEDWLHAGQSLHHEFDGSPAAMEVWREWSKRSAEKYPGDQAVAQKWETFGRYRGAPITAAWLLKHSKVARVASKYEAMHEWKTKIADAADEFDLREKVCPAIARDDRIGEFEREALAQSLQSALQRLGSKLPIAAVRKLVESPASQLPTVMAKRPITEFGNAERMLDRFGDSLMYVPEMNAWYVWTGVYWRRSTDVEIEFFAKETIRDLPKEADQHESNQGEFFAFCAISQQAKMVRNMVALAASDPRVMVPVEELDKQPFLLGVQNGVVDLRTGELSPPNRALHITRCCSANYRPGARCDLFRQTVLDVFSNDSDMAAFFQRLVGYASIGDPVEDIMVIPWGNGSNGKSTVLGTVRKALGTYARAADASTFVNDGRGGNGGGGPREDLMRLKGSRFVYVTEPDENSELKEGSVKAMTGGDAMPARGLWSAHTIEIEPTWVAWMPTNHKPIIKGSDNGIWRRLVLLPFMRSFEGMEKDEKRQEKLQAEAEGVVAYIVEGARAYLRDGLAPTASVRAAREQYRSQMDILAEWIEERCELDVSYTESMKRLWESWESFARERGILQYVKSSIALGRRFDQRFPAEKGTGGVRIRRGLRLKQGLSSDDFFGDTSGD